MAAGDLIVGATYPQYEWWNSDTDRLLMGSGTDWIVEKVTGLLGMPDIRSTDIERQGTHGDYPGRNYYRARKVGIDLAIRSDVTATFEGYLDAIKARFITRDVPGKLSYMRTGGSKRFLWAVVNRVDFDSDFDVAKRILRGSVEFKCADPRIYSIAEAATAVTISGTGTTATQTVSNAGTADSAPWLSISGPAVNPRIKNAQDNNREIKIDLSLSAGQTLIIDLKSMTATISGVIQPFRSDNQFWVLKPGNNSITYSRASGASGSTCTVNERDAWM